MKRDDWSLNKKDIFFDVVSIKISYLRLFCVKESLSNALFSITKGACSWGRDICCVSRVIHVRLIWLGYLLLAPKTCNRRPIWRRCKRTDDPSTLINYRNARAAFHGSSLSLHTSRFPRIAASWETAKIIFTGDFNRFFIRWHIVSKAFEFCSRDVVDKKRETTRVYIIRKILVRSVSDYRNPYQRSANSGSHKFRCPSNIRSFKIVEERDHHRSSDIYSVKRNQIFTSESGGVKRLSKRKRPSG